MKEWKSMLKRGLVVFLLMTVFSSCLHVGTIPVFAEENAGEFLNAELKGAYQFGDTPYIEEDQEGELITSYSNDDVKDYLYQEMLDHNSASIDISEYAVSPDNIFSLIVGVINEHPELYYVKRHYSGYEENGIVTQIYLTYNEDYDHIAFKKAARAALRLIEPSMSDLEKAIILHDYLVINCEYDIDNYNANTIPEKSYTAYGALVDHKAVCNGYALAYKYLLNQVGIDCYMVSSASMNHAWNLVNIDGAFYHVDVTWDDLVPDHLGACVYHYFLCNDDAFAKHSNWTITTGTSKLDIKATDTRYNHAFWKNSRSALIFHDNSCYYIPGTSVTIQKASLNAIYDKGIVFKSLNNEYDVKYGFSSLFVANGRLFYNTFNAIHSINFDGSDDRIEWKNSALTGYICGIALKQSSVYYITNNNLLPTRVDTIKIEKPKTYTVLFDLQGHGKVLSDYLSYTEIESGEVIEEPGKPKADGYLFLGWYKDAACEEPWNFEIDLVKDDMILYAKWVSQNYNGDIEAISGSRILSVNPTTYNTILLNWDTVAGAKSYEIFYSTSPDSGFKRLTNTKKNFYKFSKAKCGVTYYFRMRVCQRRVKSEFGPTSYAKTDLTGNTMLQIKKTTYNSVTLKWSKVAGAKKYEILYADSIGGEWQLLGVKGGTSFTHKKLVTGATYYYQVRPVRDSFRGSWSNGVSTTTVLDNVSKLKVKAASADRMKLSWRKVNGATQYVILRADKIDGTYEVIGYSGKSSYMDIGLAGGATYFYKVYAVSGPYRTQETVPVGQTTKIPKK